jgi:molybdate transport system substrate-binding protein
MYIEYDAGKGASPAMTEIRPMRFIRAILGVLACLAVFLAQGGQARAAEALVAVATNFAEVMELLTPKFAAASGHQLRVSSGSTGKLYAQIMHGAPFDLMLAADQRRPKLLEASPKGVAGSRFTYAIGRLTLWSAEEERIGADGAATLETDDFRHLAMANPKLAPYGLAAQQTLMSLGLWDALQSRIVLGENIGQAFSLVSTGNAELGFVALSAVMSPRNERAGSRWDVPADLYEPIRQDAVLLAHGADNAAARAFVDFVKSAEARKLIAAYGYGAD